MRLQTTTSKLIYEDQELEIKPGMTVTVDVISGAKSIFDYLMKPILKSRIKGNVVGHKHNATEQEQLSDYDARDQPSSAAPQGRPQDDMNDKRIQPKSSPREGLRERTGQ